MHVPIVRYRPSLPQTIVSGADAGDVDQSADTPSIGQPKLTTET
jgi:hypothetical protein